MTLENYKSRLSSPNDSSITGRLTQLRHLQAELQTQPVIGALPALKRLFYRLIHSTFSRQFNLNTAMVDLIETVYQELEQQQLDQQQQLMRLQNQLQRGVQPILANETPAATHEVIASSGKTQDQAKLNNIRLLTGFNCVYTSPAEMRLPERVVLYSLIFGLQPRYCLEIGTFRGGSSAIICGAMDDTGFGQLACVDPMPRIAPDLWTQISHRCQLFEGPSPDILPEVVQRVGSPFDFVLIDGNHTYEFVQRDIAGTLPFLANQAYLLFHDSLYDEVKRAIDEAIIAYPELTDCGLLSVEPTVLSENDQPVTWAGLRLLRFQRSGLG